MKVKNYKELKVWQQGVDIVDKVYQLTDIFPDSERFGLISQMRRAAVSLPSNIAEGFMRQHSKEYIQFLYISLGSCAELETQLIISWRRKYIEQNSLESMQENIEYESRMLRNLIKNLRFFNNAEPQTTNH